MDILLEALTSASANDRDVYRPEFFRLTNPLDRARMQEVLKSVPGIRVHDELHSQLTELVRSLDPSVKFTRPELDDAAVSHLGGIPAEHYGVWVFYPWSSRLVHLLDETEFALVRTDRNRNKITREEQAILSSKKIGVLGLSVGQSICLTLALERSFGELRIADFDTLELSNLNRIRSGVHSMGHLKTVNVAREIAELDPFLTVTLFNEGVSRDNIDRFLTEGGNLDILVDECDSVEVKIFCRQRAKALRIPVIMDTSDRGMLDVERFDLEPERPILHGLIEHLNVDDAANAKTNEEKLPFVLPILNIDTLSKRMKASMLEIESSVTSWPQLASSVVMGGALGADTCRRIALGQFSASGRWFVDLDEIVGVEKEKLSQPPSSVHVDVPHSIAEVRMVEIAEQYTADRSPEMSFDKAVIEALVEAGCMAPSGGNSQPWQFLSYDGRLFVYMDPARAFSTIDPGQIYATLAIGASLENIRLKATELGFGVAINTHPEPAFPELIAVVDATLVPVEADDLHTAIALRCTNRKKGNGKGIPVGLLHNMERAVAALIPEASVQFSQDHYRISEVAALCGRAERVRMLNPTTHWDMFSREMRWTAEEAEKTGDGVDLRTLELGLSDQTGLKVAADSEAIAMLRQWQAGTGMEKLSRKLISASAALAIVFMPDLTLASVLRGGMAVQRLWLQGTLSKLALHPASAPIFMGIHERFDRQGLFSLAERTELKEIHESLLTLFPGNSGEALFLLRLDHADPPTVRSLRRPINEVFHVHQPMIA